MNQDKNIAHFEAIINAQLQRVERMKAQGDFVDYAALDRLIIGVCGGDGIGPAITAQAVRVLECLLADEIADGRVELRDIPLTIEDRVAANAAIPPDVLERLKACNVVLKGPTTTPKAGDGWPNIESANVAMRKELDLFGNVRPVKVPELGIDWIFFRENTEGSYVLGSQGLHVSDDLAIDFCAVSTPGCERIIRLAFEHARKTGKPRVDAVTKANIIKATDGKFLDIFYKIAKEYPDIQSGDWFIDIMTANLVNPNRRTEFSVMVLPNLYGDILTDEAAEFQGGVGTAGSANIGKQYAMFEAIHGSAPRMVETGRAQYANPASMMRAAVMLLEHIGQVDRARRLAAALDARMFGDDKIIMTGRSDGATGADFADAVMASL